MSETELLWLADQASRRSCVVEIGSYLGRSTRAIADNCIGEVWAVDDFKGPRDVMMNPDDRLKIFDEFVRNMDGLQGRLNVVKADHKNVRIDASPDMVFLDGSHEPEDIEFDIKFWMKRLSPFGIICGHDFPYVFETVQKLVPNFSIVPKTFLWFAEVQTHPLYRTA